ncbi:NTP pyrophosphohydrolase including oxidative damage repair enzyme [Parachlamydia acanthamoebae UV-7]|uniref:GDP-mannose pyrophosphatase n=1 Tax=Parachlamydia acanthamoebae (strain UV7) TaxID=765952 RepID=F8L0N8_PARAV|nr:NUDIX hydrolase [Parachlamydia acanthamoebae]CCB86788.1 NTP pyrophosphohydrolase including oxidative damage repair enzyme [Parachlamydia acanthamoebae UV-7]
MQALFSFTLTFILTCHALFTFVQAGENSRRQYFELLENFPKLIESQGNYADGEIQIVLDAQEMALIEESTARDVGVIVKDKYWLWINDACIFPNGKKGVYGRILWVNSLESCPGVAVMPVMSNGKIILNCNYRHATRSWEIELPRGGINFGEKVEAAAKRETIEETGMLVDDLLLLGKIPPDTGLTSAVVPIYMAKVIGDQPPQREDSEAIEEILCLTLSEIKQAFIQGYYEHKVRGIQKQIPFRDPFLAYAILMYELKTNINGSKDL